MDGFLWDDLHKIFSECQWMDSQGTSVKIAENFDRLSRVHERYRRRTDRQTTDGRAIA